MSNNDNAFSLPVIDGVVQVSALRLQGWADSVDAGVSAAASTAATASANAIAAVSASGTAVTPYTTKALANAALASLAEGTLVEIQSDESRSGQRVRYTVESGAFVYQTTLPTGPSVEGDGTSRVYCIAGVLRQSTQGGGWSVLNNSGHTPIRMNGASVSADGLELNITYNSPDGADIVGALCVTPDETFAARGLIFGGSVSEASAILRAYAPMVVEIDLDQVTATESATGISSYMPFADGQITAQLVDNKVRINHPQVLKPSATSWTQTDNQFIGGRPEIIAQRGGTGLNTDIFVTRDLDVDIGYDGSGGFSVDSTNFTGVSLSQTSDYYVLSHPTIPATLGVTAPTIHGRYRNPAVERSLSSSAVTYRVMDLTTGLPTASPPAASGTRITRPGLLCVTGTTKAADMGIWNVNLGLARVSFNYLHHSTGNVWVHGAMLKNF